MSLISNLMNEFLENVQKTHINAIVSMKIVINSEFNERSFNYV